MSCQRCHGTGNDDGILLGWCNRCHGTGRDPGTRALIARWLRYRCWAIQDLVRRLAAHLFLAKEQDG